MGEAVPSRAHTSSTGQISRTRFCRLNKTQQPTRKNSNGVCRNFLLREKENLHSQGSLSWTQSWCPDLKQAPPRFSVPSGFYGCAPTSVLQRPFCFRVRAPELRLCELEHCVPQFIFFSGLAIPPGAAERSTPLEDRPSSSTPGEARRG